MDRLIDKGKNGLKDVVFELLFKNSISRDLKKLDVDETVEKLFRDLIDILDHRDELDLSDDSDA